MLAYEELGYPQRIDPALPPYLQQCKSKVMQPYTSGYGDLHVQPCSLSMVD